MNSRRLVRSDGFGLDFFRKMRALTSARRQLAGPRPRTGCGHTFRPPGAKDLASPLYNVFHPDPIYMGPLEDWRPRRWCEPSRPPRHRAFGGRSQAHQGNSGATCHFLQAAAEKWLIERVRRREQEECSELVIAHLMAPGNLRAGATGAVLGQPLHEGTTAPEVAD